MMKILFDLSSIQPFGETKFHGGGLYGEIFFRELINLSHKIKIYTIYDFSKFINPELIDIANKKKIIMFDKSQLSLRKVVETYEIEKYYNPLIYEDIDLPDFCTHYATIHGLRILETSFGKTPYLYVSSKMQLIKIFGEHIKYVIRRKLKKKRFKKIFFKNEIRLITVSNHTKYSIKSNFPFVDTNNIRVFYSPSLNSVSKLEYGSMPNQLKGSRFFLLTSGDRWIKNNIRAAIALDQILEDFKKLNFKKPNFKVVITGISDALIYQKKIKNIDNFVFLNYIDRPVLNSLYSNAYAMIYPSLNEGFGYPPIEAMQYGVPVMTSSFTSMQEICGNAAIYFNPYSIIEIKNRVYQLLDNDIYSDYSKKSKNHFKKISKKQDLDLKNAINYLIN